MIDGDVRIDAVRVLQHLHAARCPSMLRSVMTTWKLPVSMRGTASSPLPAVSTW